MSIIIKNFTENSISGVWKYEETENELRSLSVLSDDDLLRLSAITNTKRRCEMIAARVLSRQLGLNFQIKYQANKPFCDHGHISLSHSKSMVAVIWDAVYEVCVDIEEVNDKLLRVGERVFSDEELFFAANDPEQLTILWCCKECVYKMFGAETIDFKQNIKILPFNNGGKIKCIANFHNEIKPLNIEYLKIENNILTWGKKQ
jgi:phosphopantetheinyl transferase